MISVTGKNGTKIIARETDTFQDRRAAFGRLFLLTSMGDLQRIRGHRRRNSHHRLVFTAGVAFVPLAVVPRSLLRYALRNGHGDRALGDVWCNAAPLANHPSQRDYLLPDQLANWDEGRLSSCDEERKMKPWKASAFLAQTLSTCLVDIADSVASFLDFSR